MRAIQTVHGSSMESAVLEVKQERARRVSGGIRGGHTQHMDMGRGYNDIHPAATSVQLPGQQRRFIKTKGISERDEKVSVEMGGRCSGAEEWIHKLAKGASRRRR
jgi:hypothetical protein